MAIRSIISFALSGLAANILPLCGSIGASLRRLGRSALLAIATLSKSVALAVFCAITFGGSFEQVEPKETSRTMPIIEKRGKAKEEEHTIVVDGVARTYLIHVPDRKAAVPPPVVLGFHGGGGTAQWMNRLTGLSDLADREGFVVVYPQGIDRGWNDGREIADRTSDDVRFTTALIEDLSSRRIVDRKRVYATGISNGGFFCQYLAMMAPGSVRAIASVAATIPERLISRGTAGAVSHRTAGAASHGRAAEPHAAVSHGNAGAEAHGTAGAASHAVPILFILGTHDPVISFDGGDIAGLFSLFVKDLGKSASARATLSYWAKINDCAAKPVVERLPDSNKDDGMRVIRETYRPLNSPNVPKSRKNRNEVVAYIVEGGGHTWPSGWQYFQERYVGKTCREIDASKIIWEFFARH